MENVQKSAQPQRTKCEVWTRVMGYHRPVSQYNVGKKSEFYSRVYFQYSKQRNEAFRKKYAKMMHDTETVSI